MPEPETIQFSGEVPAVKARARLIRAFDRVTADAASRLGLFKDWPYRRSDRLPFAVQLSPGLR